MLLAKLDSFDRKILHIIQREAGLTTAELGDQIGLSSSATARRLRRMRDAGIITSTISLLDPNAIGAPTLFHVSLELDRANRGAVAELDEWLEREDKVQQAYHTTGQWDVIAIVCTDDLSAFEDFMARMLDDNPNVRRYSTNVVADICKRTFLYPIPPTAKLRSRHTSFTIA